MIWDLPHSLVIHDAEYDIRTDYRDILKILIAFDDPDLAPEEKEYVCLFIMFIDFDKLPAEDYGEAYQAAIRFIDNGTDGSKKNMPRTTDWEQDAKILFPAINNSAGFEVRSVEYLHWWTFMGYFMNIKDTVYSTVLNLRQKKARGKKFEKWEQEFWSANQDICKLKTKLSEEEQAEKDRLKAILG